MLRRTRVLRLQGLGPGKGARCKPQFRSVFQVRPHEGKKCEPNSMSLLHAVDPCGSHGGEIMYFYCRRSNTYVVASRVEGLKGLSVVF